MMKSTFTLLILTWVFSINAQGHLNPIEKLLADKVQPLRTVDNQKNVLNVGKISGQLFDKDSLELISDDINFNVNLFKKHPRFNDWVYVEGKASENSAYEFNNLEYGEYLISVSRGGGSELAEIANKAYLNSTWSASGNHTCINCGLDSDRTITLDNTQTEKQANFELEKGGLLAVTLANDDLEQSDNFRIVAINENNEVFDNSVQFTSVTGIGFPTNIGVDIKAISILPAGQYRFYTETYRLIEKTNEGIPCEYCEFDVLQNEVNQLPVAINQVTEASVSLTQSNSTVSGEFITPGLFSRGLSQLVNYNYNNNYVDVFDISSEFLLTDVNPGVYYLNHDIASPHYYGNLYAGGHCDGFYYDGVYCDTSFAKPILVVENQDVRLRPYNLPIGGSISGSVKSSESIYLLDIAYINNEVGIEYFEFYDENLNFVSQVDIVSYISQERNMIDFKQSLPSGQYYIKTGSSYEGLSNRNYVDQIYPGINCAGFYCDFSEAELITVEVGETTEAIYFNLEKGFGIRGKVTDANNRELKGVNILVYDEDFNFLGSTLSDDSGDYGFFNLPNGEYYVSTANGSQSFKAEYKYPATKGFQDQLYPNLMCPNGQCDFSQGQKITVQDSDVTAIDFQLNAGLTLSGTVTDAKTGQPIEHLSVGVYQVDGNHLGDYKTNHLGVYATGALQTGEYLIKTQSHNLYPEFVLGYGTCLYGNCETSEGTSFTFVEDQAVDFELSHKKDIYAAFSGNWFQPDESGHGFQFEVIKQNDAAHLSVIWYAHLNGKPIWLTGTGLLLGDKAYVDLNITDGSNFPADNNIQHWGSLRVDFSDLNHAKASWQPVLDGFSDGSLEIQRLTKLSGDFSSTQFDDENIGACFSGSYYNPERNGEGLIVEVLDDPANRLLISWYTYRGDEQFWMIGIGSLNGDQATIAVHYTEGSSFTPDFDPSELSTIEWGEVNVKKIDDLNLEVSFMPNSAHQDFETNQTQLTKLTEINTLRCQ